MHSLRNVVVSLQIAAIFGASLKPRQLASAFSPRRPPSRRRWNSRRRCHPWRCHRNDRWPARLRRAPPAARGSRRHRRDQHAPPGADHDGRPSALIASCTFGRAATRSLNAFRLRPLRNIDADAAGPAGHHIEIGIGRGEGVAHQVLLARELFVDPLEAVGDVCPREFLVGIRRGRTKERPDALVQLGRDEVQPLLHLVAFLAAGRRHQLRAGRLVANVLHDHRTFGQACRRRRFAAPAPGPSG